MEITNKINTFINELEKDLNEAKKPKFSVGDKVKVKNKKGTIIEIGDFDNIIKEYKYHTKIDGKIEVWNESSLEKA